MKLKYLLFCFILLTVFVISGCLSEPDSRIRRKLDIILEDDMNAIIEDMADTNLLDSTYYDMYLYQEYDEGKYSRKVEVDFYFLKKVNAKIVRKYRYHREYKKWDRYYNEYQFTESK